MNAPTISVLMSVYNGEKYLAEAMESILSQTFRDFEFLILDDASTDKTSEILEKYAGKDPRICLLRNAENKGLTASMEILMHKTRSEFIARMDADDISLPDRFDKQVRKLQGRPDYLVVGCWFQTTDENGIPVTETVFPDRPDLLARYLHKGVNCYAHGSVMMRKTVFGSLGFSYRLKYGQDFDLWLRLSEKGPLGMVEEVLYQRRDHGHALSSALIPQRAALMNLMLSLTKERGALGREISSWEEEEMKIFGEIPRWTKEEIEAHNRYLEARRLLCAGENTKAHHILLFLRKDMKNLDYTKVPYILSFFPGLLTAPLLRLRDKMINRHYFVKSLCLER